MLFQSLRMSFVMMVMFTLLLGGLYPAIVTGIAYMAFPDEASGSLIKDEKGKVIGSRLIGQEFSGAQYMWGRPSATSPAYNAAASSGSNLGVNAATLQTTVETRIKALRDGDPTQRKSIPVDIVTASASGLDPHISPAAADYQIPRLSKMRGISEETLREVIRKNTEGRTFGILGEPRVNVLQVNLDMDKISKGK